MEKRIEELERKVAGLEKQPIEKNKSASCIIENDMAILRKCDGRIIFRLGKI
ncbi:hypothetical protein L7750_16815 [Xenorhabdus bovienii]|uniref:hypothetical protein n=1 Tax=Xenorhabdus bovienii TaxID=40576 RepID=UPI001EE0C774|nr:hypothetical protein [Xenorhabdus bovienii]MCG3471982.1 hypothetical protein [Xenorhabdus bovienii]